ncbi:Sodium-coupled neutral amino acid transporter 3 [Varanus komodoensis]|nr:Sodium-coupled neutral amino acid transporter 3 [Varanus komodoensis]
MELQKMGEEMGTEKLNGTIPDNNKAAGLEDGYEEEERALTEQEEFLPHIASKKLNQFTDFEGKTTFGMSVFNLSNAIMGSGILGLAYAMKNTGIVLFLVLLICIALLSSYSIHLLLKCAGVVGIRAYEQLGFRAFGHGGKVVAAVIISIHNIGAMSSYLFIVKSELPLVIQTFLGLTENNSEWYMNGNVLIIVVSVCVILPLALMKHLGYLGYTSGLSLTCMVFFLISVIYKKFQIACPLNSTMDNNSTMDLKDESCTVEIFTINSQTAYAIPILAFAFVCHPEVLPIYTELRRAGMSKVRPGGQLQPVFKFRAARSLFSPPACHSSPPAGIFPFTAQRFPQLSPAASCSFKAGGYISPEDGSRLESALLPRDSCDTRLVCHF